MDENEAVHSRADDPKGNSSDSVRRRGVHRHSASLPTTTLSKLVMKSMKEMPPPKERWRRRGSSVGLLVDTLASLALWWGQSVNGFNYVCATV